MRCGVLRGYTPHLCSCILPLHTSFVSQQCISAPEFQQMHFYQCITQYCSVSNFLSCEMHLTGICPLPRPPLSSCQRDSFHKALHKTPSLLHCLVFGFCWLTKLPLFNEVHSPNKYALMLILAGFLCFLVNCSQFCGLLL